MMPLTSQEEAIKRLLTEQRLPFEAHHVFDLKERGGISVDFLVFLRAGLVNRMHRLLRKERTGAIRGKASSAYMDYRFGLLKTLFPKLSCGALIEAPNENQERLASQLKPILRNSDFVARSNEEIRSQST